MDMVIAALGGSALFVALGLLARNGASAACPCGGIGACRRGSSESCERERLENVSGPEGGGRRSNP